MHTTAEINRFRHIRSSSIVVLERESAVSGPANECRLSLYGIVVLERENNVEIARAGFRMPIKRGNRSGEVPFREGILYIKV